MKLRLMGSTDLITRWRDLLLRVGLAGEIYKNQRGTGSRLYLDVDDRQAQALADRLALAAPTPAPRREPARPERQADVIHRIRAGVLSKMPPPQGADR